MNRSATTANLDMKFPNKMFYREVSELKLLPFCDMRYCNQQHPSKSMAKAQHYFDLGPVRHPRDSTQLLTKGRDVITAHDMTRRRLSVPM